MLGDLRVGNLRGTSIHPHPKQHGDFKFCVNLSSPRMQNLVHPPQTSAASDEEYMALVRAISTCVEGAQLGLLERALAKSFLWAEQGRKLVELMPTNFDKVGLERTQVPLSTASDYSSLQAEHG